LEETREILSIIHRYSVLTTEPEGDIVTAFWEAHFNHILYKADDFFSGQEPEDYIDDLSKMDTITSSAETESETEKKPDLPAAPGLTQRRFGGLAIDPTSFCADTRGTS